MVCGRSIYRELHSASLRLNTQNREEYTENVIYILGIMAIWGAAAECWLFSVCKLERMLFNAYNTQFLW